MSREITGADAMASNRHKNSFSMSQQDLTGGEIADNYGDGHAKNEEERIQFQKT